MKRPHFLRRFAEYSLPPGDRAQILGDLAERNFRLRDLASVLPALWISHLRREWIAPVPKLANPSSNSSDEAIRRRTEQLRCSRGFVVVVALCSLSRFALRFIAPDLHGLIVFTPGLLLALLMLWMGLTNRDNTLHLRPLLPSPFKEYRAALHNKTLRSTMELLFLPNLLSTGLGWTGAPSWSVELFTSVAVILFLYRHYRLLIEQQNMHPRLPA
jgi:hypothetical protein